MGSFDYRHSNYIDKYAMYICENSFLRDVCQQKEVMFTNKQTHKNKGGREGGEREREKSKKKGVFQGR